MPVVIWLSPQLIVYVSDLPAGSELSNTRPVVSGASPVAFCNENVSGIAVVSTTTGTVGDIRVAPLRIGGIPG